MNKPPFDGWEARVRETARTLPYPPTPDMVAALRRRERRPVVARRVAWALLALLLVLGAALAVPGVRAGLAEFFQVGAIRINLLPASPTAEPAQAERPLATHARPTRTPRPLSALPGALTLAEAEARSPLPIRLPSYPPDLGPPDAAFIEPFEGGALLLLWQEPSDPGAVEMSLHLLGETFWGEKLIHERQFRETSVNGQWAAWLEGEHLLRHDDPRGLPSVFEVVEGNVLIWVEGTITYRLESRLPLTEAVRVAESLE